jgi:hypothetical protein
VRPYKRFVMFAMLAAAVFVASAATSEAQVRGRGRGRTSVVVVGGGVYSPYYYDPFFFADPWYGGYQYPIHPYGYGYRWAEPEAAVRLEVKPREAEVFVDGYYAGIVDDFDGTFQRLNVPPGDHEIELWLEGYRTVKQKVYLTRDNTFKIKYQMEHLASGEAPEPKPQPIDPPQDVNPPRMQQPPMPRGPMTRRMPPPPPPQQQPPDERGVQVEPRGGQRNAAYGTLAVRVQPADAEISIDGENWRGPGGQDRMTIEVSEGSHTIEIRKSGYRTYVTQIDVRRGQTTPLNVSLRGEQ